MIAGHEPKKDFPHPIPGFVEPSIEPEPREPACCPVAEPTSSLAPLSSLVTRKASLDEVRSVTLEFLTWLNENKIHTQFYECYVWKYTDSPKLFDEAAKLTTTFIGRPTFSYEVARTKELIGLALHENPLLTDEDPILSDLAKRALVKGRELLDILEYLYDRVTTSNDHEKLIIDDVYGRITRLRTSETREDTNCRLRENQLYTRSLLNTIADLTVSEFDSDSLRSVFSERRGTPLECALCFAAAGIATVSFSGLAIQSAIEGFTESSKLASAVIVGVLAASIGVFYWLKRNVLDSYYKIY